MAIEYRILTSIEEMEQAVDLEILVWGGNPRDAASSYVMHVLAHNGGLVLGAFQAQKMVGMACALAARRKGKAYLWSHVTGVHPDYQKHGIGLELKRRQRYWALQEGYRIIRWTFDPLQRGNAHFNFSRLNGIACMVSNVYHINYYGMMTDAINRDMPSDRLEVLWALSETRLDTPESMASLLVSDAQGNPRQLPLGEDTFYAVGVPPSLEALRRDNADAVLAWRYALRETLQAAFAQKYMIVDFKNNAYTLMKMEAEE